MKTKVAIVLSTTALLLASVSAPADALPKFFVASVIPHGPASIGSGSVGLAIDTEHQRVYVTNQIDDSVSVIDTRTGVVVEVISHDPTRIGRAPKGVAVDTVHDQAYVSNYLDGTVSVIDTATDSVKSVIPHGPTGIGDNPNGVAVDETHNQAYVVNSGNQTISVVDTTTNSLISNIPTWTHSDGMPRYIAVDEAHHQAYVIATGGTRGDEVLVIDSSTNTVSSVIPHGPGSIGDGASGVAVDTAHGQAYVTSYVDGSIAVIDTSRNIVKETIRGDTEHGPTGVSVDTVRNVAFVSNEISGTLSIIDTTTNTFAGVMAHGSTGIGSQPEGIAVDSSQARAYVANLGDGTVSVVEQLRITPAITSGPAPDGQTGTPYSFTIDATGEPTPKFLVAPWSALPDGLSLDASSGAISGTPTRPGVYSTVVQALNGVAPSAFVAYTITIRPGVRPGRVSW